MIVTAVGLAGLASCAQLTPDSKQEARERWSSMRSKLKYQLASETFSKGNINEAEVHLQEAISLDPEAPESYILMCRILLERGETSSARQALNAAIIHGGATAETHYLQGLIAQRHALHDEALNAYRKAAELNPTNAHYVVAVAETLVTLNRGDEALHLVREHWTDFEQNATLRALAGEIQMLQGDYESAAAAYRQAALISPDDPLLRQQFGLALSMAGQHREACQILSNALEDPDNPMPLSTQLALARSQLALRDNQAARALLRRVVEEHPHQPRAWALLARAALGCEDLLTARRASAEASRLDPAHSEYKLLLAYVCSRQADYPSAVPVLRAVIDRSPDDMMALFLLGRCLMAQGDTEAAAACGHQALQIDPRCEWAVRLLQGHTAQLDSGTPEWSTRDDSPGR
jgi:cytochrome c-type biogenesis protein CcmH/NrfG